MKALLLAPMGSVHRRFNNANINALQLLGYDVELVANFENGYGPEVQNQKYVEECNNHGINTYSLPFKRHSLLGCLKCLPKLKALLFDGKYDIVHAHTETGGLLLKLAVGVKGKSKFFYTPHGMSFWEGSSLTSQLVYKPLERWICSGMDMNLGMNREEVNNLEQWNRNTATYIHGIGLNIKRMHSTKRSRQDVREEFNVKEGEKLVVSIGELDENKNHSTVIRALSKTGRKDVKYVICGVGPKKDALLQQIEEFGLKDNVILAGYRTDIPEILNSADIFIFPSFHEGMPVSALEAMACGLPLICSKIRGNVDIVVEDLNGYLFPPSDVDILAHKIELLLDDSIKRRFMGDKNREIVEDFSLTNVTEELIGIYSKGIKNSNL